MENSSTVMRNSQPLTIVCAADDKYVMPLTVTINSVLANLRNHQQIVVFVIDGGIRQSNKHKIINSLSTEKVDVKIQWVQPRADLLEKMKVSGHVTVATYFRLLIPDLLPDWFNKAIYLDGDIVVNEDLGKLWDLELGDNYLLAVQDTSAPYVSSPAGLTNYKELGIPSDWKYFNAGVLAINLQKWRTDSVSAKVIQYLAENEEHVRWWDQDGLNAILAGKWGELDPKWNVMLLPHLYDCPSLRNNTFNEDVYNGIVKNPCILHFASSSKPWTYNYRFPAKDLFFQYLDQTAWSGWRPKESFKSKINRSWWWKFMKETKNRLMSFGQRHTQEKWL
jgi:lipopolysaccharide biosynthesis glycosyltransferase